MEDTCIGIKGGSGTQGSRVLRIGGIMVATSASVETCTKMGSTTSTVLVVVVAKLLGARLLIKRD